jgi:putative MATE family efflux protein
MQSSYSLTEGGILKKLLFVAIPIMGTQLMQMAYNLTDMFWLGRLGSDAVAAVGTAGMYLWLSFGFLVIGKIGAEIGVSQYLGKGDKKGALQFSQNATVIGLVLGLLFGLALIFFNRSLLGFFNFREEEVARDAALYLFICGFPMPLVFVTAVATGTFNASGNSRTPFILNAFGLLLNIILDPIFIFTLGMGVKGAGLATLFAQLISCSAILFAMFFSKNRPFERYSLRFWPELSKIVRIIKWALPVGLESILFCFLTMITTRIETSFGADAIAVSKIGVQIESLSWLIGGGFGSALLAFVGQNYGAQ